jgi:hypothetical protein
MAGEGTSSRLFIYFLLPGALVGDDTVGLPCMFRAPPRSPVQPAREQSTLELSAAERKCC